MKLELYDGRTIIGRVRGDAVDIGGERVPRHELFFAAREVVPQNEAEEKFIGGGKCPSTGAWCADYTTLCRGGACPLKN